MCGVTSAGKVYCWGNDEYETGIAGVGFHPSYCQTTAGNNTLSPTKVVVTDDADAKKDVRFNQFIKATSGVYGGDVVCALRNLSCTLPWSGTLANKGTVTAYSTATGPCTSEVRTCDKGTLSGTYTFQTCM